MTIEATEYEIAEDASARIEAAEISDLPANRMTTRGILICDTQPVAVEGMKWLIETSGDLHVVGSVSTLEAVQEIMHPGTARLAADRLASERVAIELAALAASSAAVAAPATPPPGLVPVTALGDTALSDAIAPQPPMSFSGPAVRIDAIVIDKALGIVDIMAFLQKNMATSNPAPIVVWGAVSEAEALRLLQAGARGILRRTSESGTLLTCLRSVTAGGAWMEDGIFGSTDKLFNPRRSELTHREREVVVLVEKGLRNRDIAGILGIQTGTVKIHLKHIFEKTGVRGRYGLAFTGLQNRGSITVAAPTFQGVE